MSPSRASNTKDAAERDAEAQLESFVAKFSPDHQRVIRSVRKGLRARLPVGTELVYDNYNFFVIGFGPTERPSDAIFSLVAGVNGVSVCFIHGPKLPDPTGILRGEGKQTRSIRIDTVSILAQPGVEALFTAAVARSKAPFPETVARKLIIRSISAKQRPRRKDT